MTEQSEQRSGEESVQHMQGQSDQLPERRPRQGGERKAEREVGGVPRVTGQPTPLPIWLMGPRTSLPSALTPQTGEPLEGPGVSEVVLAMPINLPGDKEICNLVKMTCCLPNLSSLGCISHLYQPGFMADF